MDKHRKAVLSFPFQIDPWTHHAALCDEAQRIRTSVFLILSTHVKERWMLSSFGSRLKDYVFENQGVEMCIRDRLYTIMLKEDEAAKEESEKFVK